MQPKAGVRDTLITFQVATKTQETARGTISKSWADITPTEWAEVQDVLPSRSENIEPGIDMALRPCRIRTLYRSDITPQHRVKIGSRILEIKSGPIILGSPGRPEGLEMVCTEYSSPGETP
jgi:head-tail adaptor